MATDARTVRLAVALLERTAGRRRRCRRCRGVIVENAGKAGTAWSVCGPCEHDIEHAARQAEIEDAPIHACIVCRADLSRRHHSARTCGNACRTLISRIRKRSASTSSSSTNEEPPAPTDQVG